MALTDTFTRNGWRELEEMESYLEAVHRAQGRAWREVRFLGSPAAQLPGSRQNTWREPRGPLA